MKTTLPLTLLAALLLPAVGCGSSDAASISGRVSDDDSTARTGGSGSVDTAVEVRAIAMTDGGSTVLGTADVELDGSYVVELDGSNDGDTIVVQALDADERVVASTLVASMSTSGSDPYAAAPMTTETSVEAEVWLSTVERYGERSADAVQTRVIVDADVAVEVRQSDDSDADIDALADGMAAGLETEMQIWASAGGSLDSRTRTDAMGEVMAEYDAALAAGADIEAAWEAVLAARVDAASDAGLMADARADAESGRGLALRAVVAARSSNEDVFDGIVVTSGRLEGRATAEAFSELYASSGRSDDAWEAMLEASTELKAELRDADSADAAAGAWADFEAAVIGDLDESTVFDLTLDVDLVGLTALDLALSTSEQASIALEAMARAEAESMNSGSNVDLGLMSSAVVDGWSDYRLAVDTAFDSVFSDDEDVRFASELVVGAEGRFLVTD